MNEINRAEIFAADACYDLARKIMDRANKKGLYLENPEDVQDARTLRTIAELLEGLGDARYTEFAGADDLIILPPPMQCQIIKLPAWRLRR